MFYLIINIKDNSETVCNTSGSNQCVVELNKTGTYKIESYEGNNEISSRYINAKIAKNGSNFTLSTSDGKSKYTLSQTNCSNNVTTKKVKFNITKENKTVEIFIPKGSSPHKISKILKDSEVIYSQKFFLALIKIYGY